MMRKYFLETKRCAFSVWTEDDLDLATLLWSDENVTKYICASGRFTGEEIKERLLTEIKNYAAHKVQYFPVFEKSTGEFIGCCGLRPHRDEGTFEAGFHLRPEFQRKGYAAEAADAIIKYAFGFLGAERIFAGHNPKNTPSRKVLTKLGFKYTHDEFYPPTGLMHPSYIRTKE